MGCRRSKPTKVLATHFCVILSPMTMTTFHVDKKGRVNLTQAVRGLAKIEPDSQLVGRVESGRIVLETVEAVQHRIWSNAVGEPLQNIPDGSTAGFEAQLLDSRMRTEGEDLDEIGSALLADLGL